MKTCIRPNHQAHARPRRALASRRSKKVLWLESVPVSLFERNGEKTPKNGLRYHRGWSAGGNSASQMGARTRWTKRQAVIAPRACTVLTGAVSYLASDPTSGEVRNPGNLQQQNQENQASECLEERSTPQAPTQWLGRAARLSLIPSHRGVGSYSVHFLGRDEALSSGQKLDSTEDHCQEASGGNIICSA